MFARDPEQPNLAGLRVLVVEDNSFIALAIEGALTDQGAEIVGPMSTATEASKLVTREHVDVAVLDIGLADGRVFPLVDLLNTAGVPMLFVTGYGQEVVPRRYRNVPRIEKPFSTDDLIGTVAAQAGREQSLGPP